MTIVPPSEIKRKKEMLEIKRKLWCDVYLAYVSSANAVTSDGAGNWADLALKRFDERFNK